MSNVTLTFWLALPFYLPVGAAALLPIATFALSVAVGIVAWLQWRLARSKLRLDLFDRRYKIYETTSKFVDSINNDPEHVDSYLNDFNAGTWNAGFLFDADVVNYIQVVREKAVHMRTAHTLYEAEERKTQPDEAARVRNIKGYEADRAWLVKQATAMTTTFAPYLGFQNIKA
jgi:hypothetical protein